MPLELGDRIEAVEEHLRVVGAPLQAVLGEQGDDRRRQVTLDPDRLALERLDQLVAPPSGVTSASIGALP